MMRPGTAVVEVALWKLSPAEHQAFAKAILARAREWTAAGATGRERPAAWPVVIQVQQDPRALSARLEPVGDDVIVCRVRAA